MRNTAPSAGDDRRVNQRAWTPRAVEDLLHGHPGSDPDLAGLVQTLRAGRRLPPATGALAHVLSGELALTDITGHDAPSAHRSRRWTRPRRAALLAVLAVGPVLTGAAAANALPAPAQRAAASVLNALTPFTFPAPKPDVHPTRPATDDQPVPATTPTGDQTPDPERSTPASGDLTHPTQGHGNAPQTDNGSGDGSGDDRQPTGPARGDGVTDDGDGPTLSPQGGHPAPTPASSDDAPEQTGSGADNGTTPTGTGESPAPSDDTGTPAPGSG